MGEKDDGLTLSLSLKCPEINHDSPLSWLPPPPPPPAPAKQPSAPVNTPFPLNLLNSGQLPFLHRHNHHQKASLPYAFLSSSDLNAETRSYARGIDVNRTATAAECEEDAVVSSPNSTVSSVSGKRAEREENNYEAAERDSSSHGVSEEEDDGGDAAAAARKKLRLSKDQAAVLEETFKEHNALNPKQKLALAKQLDLRPRQVEVWFQNRRARTKLKQTEVDCEYLKRCCETLTEENRRLQKEVNELRALKLSPQFYMNMNPPTTLTMCPQCERVAVTSSSSVGATSSAPGMSGITKALHQTAGNPQHQTPVPLIPRPSIIPHPPSGAQRPRW